MARRIRSRTRRTPSRRVRVTFKARTPSGGRKTITFLTKRKRRN